MVTEAIPQLSLAVGLISTGWFPEQVFISAAHDTTGFSVSFTVTVMVQVELFPQSSFAVHTITVVPIGYSPEASSVWFILFVNVNEPQVSVTEGFAMVNKAPHFPGSLFAITSVAHAITGAVTSCTLMVCDAFDEFPQASVAVQVRVMRSEARRVG